MDDLAQRFEQNPIAQAKGSPPKRGGHGSDMPFESRGVSVPGQDLVAGPGGRAPSTGSRQDLISHS